MISLTPCLLLLIEGMVISCAEGHATRESWYSLNGSTLGLQKGKHKVAEHAAGSPRQNDASMCYLGYALRDP